MGWFSRKTKKPIKQVAATPPEAVIRRFIALKNFHCDATNSDYVRGLMYNLRKGNAGLAQRCERWLIEGKIKWR